MRLQVILILTLLNAIFVHCFVDPISLAGFGFISSVLYIMTSDKPAHNAIREPIVKAARFLCEKVQMCEGCEDSWIPGNIDKLEFDLRNNVFGQTLAVDVVLAALRNHLSKRKEPDRALMLSFHGTPGTGKNFISTKILHHMFYKGEKSGYVQMFRSAIEFPEKLKVAKYKEDIVETIEKKMARCKRSIFVFDEVEKMPNGILDVLSAYVKHANNGEFDYRKAIFILLTNIGGKALTRETLGSWKSGIYRDEMDVNRLSKILSIESFNTDGGLYKTGIVENYGVSHYVPFLPLDRSHVIQCLEREVSKMGQIMSPELTEQVLAELTFSPEPERLFASGGCKGVSEKASVLIEKEMRKRKKRGY